MAYIILFVTGVMATLVVSSKWSERKQYVFIFVGLLSGLILTLGITIVTEIDKGVWKGWFSFLGEIPWFEIGLYFSMVAGMAAKYIYDQIGINRKIVFKKWQFFRPILISPIVFGAIYGNLDPKTSKLLLLIFSFQNGFFWHTLLNRENDRIEIKPVYRKNNSSNKKKTKNDKPIKILFLSANPTDTSQLRLSEEMRDIDQALRQAEFREKFDIRQQWAVRISDLQGSLLRHKPDLVHFSGHGSRSNEIVLEDKNGNSQTVPSDALSDLFSNLKDNIKCVVLNACYSELQARAIAQHIDCVIGMSKAIADEAAINFSVAFYQALGYGKSVKAAFELGRGMIHLQSLNEQDKPKLIAFNSNPEELVFVQNV
ncbi:CHAT domain-containing protein [candidate division KSB1 bacterium]|nr:CHAT domain-containing protein [candidate division KSB1 bacterium]